MTDAEIRATLRGACSEGIVNAWDGPFVSGAYSYQSQFGPTEEWSREVIEAFCGALREAGVTPLPKEWDR